MKYQKLGEPLETAKRYGPRSIPEDPKSDLSVDHEELWYSETHVTFTATSVIFTQQIFEIAQFFPPLEATATEGLKEISNIFQFYEILNDFLRRSFKIS